jgi:hypothetical protein
MRDHAKDEMADERVDRKESSRVQPRRPYWRFEDLDLAVKFHRIAKRLDKRRLSSYAE